MALTDRWTATFCGQPLASALASISGGGGDSGGGCAFISSVDLLAKKSKTVENGTLQNLSTKIEGRRGFMHSMMESLLLKKILPFIMEGMKLFPHCNPQHDFFAGWCLEYRNAAVTGQK